MTIREIANLAGVSPAAVSLVINNKKGVSEETRRRVQTVIEENNYTVPGQKRVSGKPKRFRLCVIKFRAHGIALEENQGFIASIIDQIESECRHYGYDLAMFNCEVSTAAETLREHGFAVLTHCGGGSFKSQMKKADGSGATARISGIGSGMTPVRRRAE